MSLPLAGVTVLEFSQYLAGPYAGLRLADLGARVIKIERPGKGDACRQLATKNLWADGDSVLFHTINRNKESFSADLKNPADVVTVKKLIAQADIVTHNFRPGIMQRLGLDYESVKTLNPSLIYGEVSGYGDTGPWKDKPGQDLLAQSVSGLTWVTGNGDQPPTPFGIAVADMLCGTHLAQGLLAAMVRKKRFGLGGKVNVSLLESILDFQFEGLTAYLNSDNELPQRSQVANAHPYVGAPYGIYTTANGHIAISMGNLKTLCDAIGLQGLEDFYGVDAQYFERDKIKAALQKHLKNRTSGEWLQMLEQGSYWCSEVLDYEALTQHEAYQVLRMEQNLQRGDASLTTTRCPIRYNGARLYSSKAAPRVGADNEKIAQEFSL
ncbi:CaiB/BaiF CoA transferase family protein [Gilvimarinus polysaccharolyticus]|uniref:CaiB/BaiF CoA transferase family protein n=1 Tax=Gilvimarinus polysaccharolyticus TaxID=863921 RepID=UPI000673A9A7|nr:CaiB/BaiF CoA-transferase family protein [Gilvimarinus polysaccharolyticus]